MILTIYSEPTRHLYQDARDLPNLPEKEARHEILAGVGALRSEVGGENAHFPAQLRRTAATAALLAVPPLGCAAELIDHEGTVIFSGVVQSAELGESPSLQVQA